MSTNQKKMHTELTYRWSAGLPEWLKPEATTREEAVALREWSKNVRAMQCDALTGDGEEFTLIVSWRHAEAQTSGLPENCYPAEDYGHNFAVYDGNNDEITSGEGDDQAARKALENYLKLNK